MIQHDILYCTMQLHLDSTYQKHLSKLDQLSSCLQDKSETQDGALLKTHDVESLKQNLQQNKVQTMTSQVNSNVV